MIDFDHAPRCARIPATEFQRAIGTMIHRCIDEHEDIIMTRHGRDTVVLLSASEYARLRLAVDHALATALAVTPGEG